MLIKSDSLYTETNKLGISFRTQAILPFVKRQQNIDCKLS